MLERIIEEIGYEMAGRMKIHYCIPMLTIGNNGLRELKDDHSFMFMVTLVDIGQHFFSLYLDHDQSLSSKAYDDVVHYPVAPLPAVISPAKPGMSTQPEYPSAEEPPVPIQVVYPTSDLVEEHDEGSVAGRLRTTKRNRGSSAAGDNEGTDESVEDSDWELNDAMSDSEEVSDLDFELQDSDFALSEEDADLGGEEETSGKGKSTTVKQRRKRGTNYNAATEKGKENCEIKEEDSDEEDLWGRDSDDEIVRMKFRTFRDDDLNDPKFSPGQVFANVDLLRKAIRAYSCIHRKGIKLPINDKKRVRAVCEKNCSWYLWASADSRTGAFQIKRYTAEHTCRGRWKVSAFTANFIAEKYLESFRADQQMSLKNFSSVVQKGWNMTPTRSKLHRAKSIAMTVIYGDEEEQYKRLWDYANEIRRSNPGSTFYLSLDDNARFKQFYMSLAACKRGFLQGCRPVIFIDGCHIKTRYRGQLLTAVGMDPNDCIVPVAMAAVEVEDTALWTWFLETLKADLGLMNTTPWTIMSDKQKGLINVVKDVFLDLEHRYILEARELPVLSMFETVKCQLMSRHYTKNKERSTWPGPICPKIMKKLQKNIKLANNVFADGAGDGLFQVGELVSSQPVDYVVDLKHKTCTCMRWQKTGIPCPHVISCLRHDDIDPVTLVDTCYSVEMHDKAYGNIFYPCKDKSEWERMNGPPILPPLYQKHVGRPTKSRRKAPYEIDARGGGKKMTRHGVIMHCTYCGFPDHNRAGCKWFKAGLPAPTTADQPLPDTVQEHTQAQNIDINIPVGETHEDLLVNNLVEQRPVQRHMETGPIPDSTFITEAQSLLNQPSGASTLRQGELAQKLLHMQQEKNNVNEERKLAVLEAKYQDEVKKAQDKARKKLEKELLAAEKREKIRHDAELKKLAREETRRIIAEVKKEVAEKKKKKKKEAAEKKELGKLLADEQKRKTKRDAKVAAEVAQSETHQAKMLVNRALMAANDSEEVDELENVDVPQMPLTRSETILMSQVVTEPVPRSSRMEWYLGLKKGGEGQVQQK